MSLSRLILGVGLSLLIACDNNEPNVATPKLENLQEEAPSPQTNTDSNIAVSEHQETSAKDPIEEMERLPAHPALILSQNLEKSSLRLRANIGGTLVQDYAAALLHPQVFSPGISADSTQRLVVAYVPDLDEAALRDPSCKVSVLRNREGQDQQSYAGLNSAKFITQDKDSRLAVFSFDGAFPARLDTGLEFSEIEEKDFYALENTSEGKTWEIKRNVPQFPPARVSNGVEHPQMPAPPPIVRNSSMVVGLHKVSIQENIFSHEQAIGSLGTVVIVDHQGKLSGFGKKDDKTGVWSFIGLVPLNVNTGLPSYVFQSARFDDSAGSSDNVRLKLSGELQDDLNQLKSFTITYKEVEADFALPKEGDSYVNLVTDGKESNVTLGVSAAENREIQLYLKLNEEKAKTAYIIQLQGATAYRAPPLIYSKPLLVTLERRGQVIYPLIKGLPGEGSEEKKDVTAGNNALAGSPVSPATAGAVMSKTLTTESDIEFITPMLNGREILIKLKEAPFWKRLNLENGVWLPLPKEDLSVARLAGNGEAIFVAMQGARELKRYNAKTLELEATGSLPTSTYCHFLAAASCSKHAPIVVLTEQDLLIYNSKSLQRESALGRGRHNASDGDKVSMSGNGRGLLFHRKNNMASGFDTSSYLFMGYALAFSPPHTVHNPYGYAPTASDSLRWDHGSLAVLMSDGSTKTVKLKSDFNNEWHDIWGTVVTSPIYFQIRTPYKKSIPPEPAGVSLYSALNDEKFLEFGSLEFWDLERNSYYQMQERVAFDPQSLTVALWHQPRALTLYTSDRAKLKPLESTVLLNLPDGFSPKDTDISFKPLFLDPREGQVELLIPGVKKDSADPSNFIWKFNSSSPQEQQLMALKVGRSNDRDKEISLSVNQWLQGNNAVAVLPASMSEDSVNAVLKRLENAEKLDVPIASANSKIHFLNKPFNAVDSGLNDFLILIDEDGSFDFFSLSDGKITPGKKFDDSIGVFAAGDCLFTYDKVSRTLSSYGVPDLTPRAMVSMPRQAKLLAVSVGRMPDSPVTLLLGEADEKQKYSENTLPLRSIQVLDKATLRSGSWANFKPQQIEENEEKKPLPNYDMSLRGTLNFFADSSGVPKRIPCSQDGRLLFLPGGQIVVSPSITTDYSFETKSGRFNLDSIQFGKKSFPASYDVSLKGVRVYTNGRMIVANTEITRIDGSMQRPVPSTCETYLIGWPEGGQKSTVFSIASLSGQKLLTLGGIQTQIATETGFLGDAPRVLALGHRNMLVFFNSKQNTVQLVDFNLPEILPKVAPDKALVTSAPMPFVASGRAFNYKIETINPSAIKEYRLRDMVSGASLSATGHFSFRSPGMTKLARQFLFTAELVLKSGEVVTHEFPVYEVPVTGR